MASNQSQKVRVIAKIRGYSDLELESGAADLKPWISVCEPGREGEEFQTVALSFGDNSSRRESYEVHSCYVRDRDNAVIFGKEIKPLISEVIGGKSATVIAYGARGSGKTHLIQGSEEDPGLAVIAMAEILSAVEESGNSVTVSMYEIDNEHAYDLLDQKRPEVLVLDNSQGMVQLKGLSQVPVKSMSEFQKLYISKQEKQRQSKKISSSALYRNHRGLMIHVFHKETLGSPLGKMNFLDLAAFEDARRKSIDGPSLSKINKSIYALQNVVYALNTNASHVPYRESRLTRMLQDSLRGTNRILMVACLNPSFCQDSATVASLASRVVRAVNKFVPESAKKSKSITRPMVHSSHKSRMLGSASTIVRKQISSQGLCSEKKTNQAASKIKARKLFDEACQSSKLKKNTQKVSVREISVLDTVQANQGPCSENKTNQTASRIKARKLFDEACQSAKRKKSTQKVSVQASSVLDTVQANLVAMPCDDYSEQVMPSLNSNAVVPTELQKSPKKDSMEESLVSDTIQTNKCGGQERVPLPCEDSCEIPSLNSTTKAFPIAEQDSIDKENNSPLVSENGTARISERMQELSTNLKLLFASIPSYVETPPNADNMCIPHDAADIPVPKNDLSSGDNVSPDILQTPSEIDNMCIPHDASAIPVPNNDLSSGDVSMDIPEPKTPDRTPHDRDYIASSNPWHTFNVRSAGMKNSLVEEYLKFLNTADKAELKRLKGIGEKRATYILELRDESPEPFKNLDDLKEIGLSAKQIKAMMRKEIGGLFN